MMRIAPAMIVPQAVPLFLPVKEKKSALVHCAPEAVPAAARVPASGEIGIVLFPRFDLGMAGEPRKREQANA